jgi:hypothetical protein
MNIARLRKSLERLEHLLKAPSEAATQTSEYTCEQRERDELWMLGLKPIMGVDLTPEEKTEFERLNAMYPEKPNPLSWEEMMQIMEDEGREERQAQKKRRR